MLFIEKQENEVVLEKTLSMDNIVVAENKEIGL